jgi:hypothetical protein
MVRSLSLFVAMSLVACSTVQPVPREPVSTASQHRFEKNYTLGAEGLPTSVSRLLE